MNLYKINLHIVKLENGQFLATSDDVPGMIAQGRSINETIEIAQDVARKIIESHVEHGDPLPESLVQIENEADVDITVVL